jgi:hypothetical protein
MPKINYPAYEQHALGHPGSRMENISHFLPNLANRKTKDTFSSKVNTNVFLINVNFSQQGRK